jgi:hypothetical protein
MRKSNDQTMKEAVESMLKAFRLDGKMQQLKLIASWEKVMGPAVARRTVEIKFIGKTLFITLNSAALRQELFQERERLVKLLNEENGGEVVGEIVFN